ncbi:hypothetical protein Tco_1368102 [Tanacetum coccineum]
MPSLRCESNDEALLLNLDMLEEKRENAAIHEAKSKVRMENNEARHTKEGGKLSPKWEGPYEVVEALTKGAYKIRNKDRDILQWT